MTHTQVSPVTFDYFVSIMISTISKAGTNLGVERSPFTFAEIGACPGAAAILPPKKCLPPLLTIPGFAPTYNSQNTLVPSNHAPLMQVRLK